MSQITRENISSDAFVPHPQDTTQFCPDPDLGLTPERSPPNSKKSVRFVSPAKSKAKRKVNSNYLILHLHVTIYL